METLTRKQIKELFPKLVEIQGKMQGLGYNFDITAIRHGNITNVTVQISDVFWSKSETMKETVTK